MYKRLFIAINLPDALKDTIGIVLAQLIKKYNHKHINWVEPKLMHLTLVFIGDTKEEQVYKIEKIIEEQVSKFKQTDIITQNFSAFPNEQNPKVLFLKTKNLDSKLFQLHKNIIDALLNKGIESDLKKLKLHITIARIKDNVRINFEKLQIQPYEFIVKSIDLMQSTLTDKGPEYKILKKFKLNE